MVKYHLAAVLDSLCGNRFGLSHFVDILLYICKVQPNLWLYPPFLSLLPIVITILMCVCGCVDPALEGQVAFRRPSGSEVRVGDVVGRTWGSTSIRTHRCSPKWSDIHLWAHTLTSTANKNTKTHIFCLAYTNSLSAPWLLYVAPCFSPYLSVAEELQVSSV